MTIENLNVYYFYMSEHKETQIYGMSRKEYEEWMDLLKTKRFSDGNFKKWSEVFDTVVKTQPEKRTEIVNQAFLVAARMNNFEYLGHFRSWSAFNYDEAIEEALKFGSTYVAYEIFHMAKMWIHLEGLKKRDQSIFPLPKMPNPKWEEVINAQMETPIVA